MFEPLFGDLFDLDGDGKATFEEELIGMHIISEVGRESRKDSDPFGAEEDFTFGEDEDMSPFDI